MGKPSKKKPSAMPILQKPDPIPKPKTPAKTENETEVERPAQGELCIRCPSFEDAQKHQHGNDFAKCRQDYPTHDEQYNADDLWWGFTEGPAPEGMKLERKFCNDLLEYAKAVYPWRSDYTDFQKEEFPKVATKQKQKAKYLVEFEEVKDEKDVEKAGNEKMDEEKAGEEKAGEGKGDEEKKVYVEEKMVITKGMLEVAVTKALSEKTEQEKKEEKAAKLGDISFFKAPIVWEMPKHQAIRIGASSDQLDTCYDAAENGFPVNTSSFQGKSPEQADLTALRTAFARPDGTFQIYTNHFQFKLPEHPAFLHEYIIESPSPEWVKATRNKRKVLINSLINNCLELKIKTDQFASDGWDKIVSVDKLWPNENDEKKAKVKCYKPGIRNEHTEIELKIRHSTTYMLSKLRTFVQGQDVLYKENGVIEALNIIIAKAVTSGAKSTFQLGKSNKFFHRPGWAHLPNNKEPDSSGLVVIRGYSCSLRPSMGCVTLNINTATSAFYKAQTVHEFLTKFGEFPSSVNGDDQEKKRRAKNLRDANDYLKKLRVYVNFERKEANKDRAIDDLNRRAKTICNIETYASEVTIGIEGNSTTVLKYLSKKYPKAKSDQYQLAVNVGSVDQPKYYLSGQLTVLSDQVYRDKVPPQLVSGMIEFARRPAYQNRNAILDEGLFSLGLKEDMFSPMLKTVRIEIRKMMMSIPARRVPTPTLLYKTPLTEKDTKDIEMGKWSTFSKNYIDTTRRYRVGAGRVCVFFVNDAEASSDEDRVMLLQNFKNLHQLNGHQKLIISGFNQTHTLADSNDAWTHENLKSKLLPLKDQVDLFVLFLPFKNARYALRHANFKSICEQVLGVRSVVFCEESMINSIKRGKDGTYNLHPKALGGYFGNVTMKLNLRLGNVNHILDPKHLASIGGNGKDDDFDCMILGADVTHPSGGSMPGTPSIAAVVGTIDKTFAPFRGSMRHQTAREESIEHMEAMTTECLDRWSRNNKKLPKRILYYRDGVSESDYGRVRQTEIVSIRKACGDAYQKRRIRLPAGGIKITAVVVAKRHNTRFYPKDETNGPEGKNGNVQPGTLVDSGITSPYFMDFYLQSHNPLEGSGKPAHYFVLENGMDFTPQELQDLTNNLCYTYERSTTAVSYVPAAYYADRLCERGRQYLKEFFDGDREFRETFRDKTFEETRTEIMQQVATAWNRGNHGSPNPWHPNLDTTMFWM